MIAFDATYYDGRTSARTPVQVRASERSLHIVGAGIDIEVPLAEIRVDARIGDARRSLALPDGALLRTDDHTALAALFPSANRFQAWVQALERQWGYALAGLVVIAACAWWLALYGLPLAAKVVAHAIPQSAEIALGRQALAAFDKTLCSTSHLDAERSRGLGASLARLTADVDDGYRYALEPRACDAIGANAFALPGGTIVVTDDLVQLAQTDEQIAAVLAHEIGHVHYRHSLRLALQATGAAALLAALAGDAVSITQLAVTLPTLLLHSGYSRDLETEADTYAFQRLKAVGSSSRHLAEILKLLETAHAKRQGGRAPSSKREPADARERLDYIATHPATAERIARALANQ